MKKLLTFLTILPLSAAAATTSSWVVSCTSSTNNAEIKRQFGDISQKAWRDSNTKFVDYTNNFNYYKDQNENTRNWQDGTIFSGYCGLGSHHDILKSFYNSNLNNFTMAFSNSSDGDDGTPYDTMTWEGANANGGYEDQIKAIRAMGGQVTAGFGGAYVTNRPAIWKRSPGSLVLAKHLSDFALSYGFNGFDFDIEGSNSITDKEANMLGEALKATRHKLANLNRNLNIRFTLADGTSETNNIIDIMSKYIGTDFLINWMVSKSDASSLDAFTSKVTQIFNKLKANPIFAGLTDQNIWHHVGWTCYQMNDAQTHWTNYDVMKQISKYAVGFDGSTKTNNHHIGYLGGWSNPTNLQSNAMMNSFNYGSWADKTSDTPGNIEQLRAVVVNQKYTTLTWDNDPNAIAYEVLDKNDNNTVIADVQRNTVVIPTSFNDSDNTNGKYTVVPVGYNGNTYTGKDINIATYAKNKLLADQIYSWDNLGKYKATDKYSDFLWSYKGKIYKDKTQKLDCPSSQIKPDEDSVNFEKVDISSFSGITDEYLALLKDGERLDASFLPSVAATYKKDNLCILPNVNESWEKDLVS